ncbi:MAG: carbon-nitrogen family hydrolase, partial [Bacteroidetes bacterium]
ICYDLRFPELYRFYAKEQVDLLVNIANWPVQRIEHWKALLKARAIENQAYMIGVNRTGTDPFYEYNGRSGVYDPMGNEIFLADEEENFFSIEIDDKLATETKDKLPFLRDMKLV